jgi:hypothetical protein
MPRKKDYSLASNSERFWSKVQKSESCWIWNAYKDKDGYGTFATRVAAGKPKRVRAHRFAYEISIGPIQDGLVLDHIVCNNPSCVNPSHLKPTTNKENVFRSGKSAGAINAKKTHCINGHLFDRFDKRQRLCQKCDTLRHQKYALKKERQL